MKHGAKLPAMLPPYSAEDRSILTLPRYTHSTAGAEMALSLIPGASGPGRWTTLDRAEMELAALS